MYACGAEAPPEVAEDWQPADDLEEDLGGPDEPPLLMVDDDFEDPEEPDLAEDEVLFEEQVDDPDLEGASVVTMQRAGGPMAEARTYRVLHWNIAGGKENGCRTKGITRAVRRYVKQHDIDFVGLNEVCPSQHRSIRRALRKVWGKRVGARFSAYVGDATNRGSRIVGNSIFSRWNLKQITKLKVGEDRYGDRNLLCGQVRNKPHLRFCSAHLSPADGKARVQMRRVRKRIERWWKDRRDTVILAGDINLRADDPGLDSVYARGANTPNNPGNFGRYRELDDNDPNHCKGYGQRSVPNTTGGPCREGGKIDFIFARRNRIVDGRYAGRTLNIPGDCGGSKCSDHRAVFGRARLLVRVD